MPGVPILHNLFAQAHTLLRSVALRIAAYLARAVAAGFAFICWLAIIIILPGPVGLSGTLGRAGHSGTRRLLPRQAPRRPGIRARYIAIRLHNYYAGSPLIVMRVAVSRLFFFYSCCRAAGRLRRRRQLYAIRSGNSYAAHYATLAHYAFRICICAILRPSINYSAPPTNFPTYSGHRFAGHRWHIGDS